MQFGLQVLSLDLLALFWPQEDNRRVVIDLGFWVVSGDRLSGLVDSSPEVVPLQAVSALAVHSKLRGVVDQHQSQTAIDWMIR